MHFGLARTLPSYADLALQFRELHLVFSIGHETALDDESLPWIKRMHRRVHVLAIRLTHARA